jgi:hypothetical protein
MPTQSQNVMSSNTSSVASSRQQSKRSSLNAPSTHTQASVSASLGEWKPAAQPSNVAPAATPIEINQPTTVDVRSGNFRNNPFKNAQNNIDTPTSSATSATTTKQSTPVLPNRDRSAFAALQAKASQAVVNISPIMQRTNVIASQQQAQQQQQSYQPPSQPPQVNVAAPSTVPFTSPVSPVMSAFAERNAAIQDLMLNAPIAAASRMSSSSSSDPRPPPARRTQHESQSRPSVNPVPPSVPRNQHAAQSALMQPQLIKASVRPNQYQDGASDDDASSDQNSDDDNALQAVRQAYKTSLPKPINNIVQADAVAPVMPQMPTSRVNQQLLPQVQNQIQPSRSSFKSAQQQQQQQQQREQEEERQYRLEQEEHARQLAALEEASRRIEEQQQALLRQQEILEQKKQAKQAILQQQQQQSQRESYELTLPPPIPESVSRQSSVDPLPPPAPSSPAISPEGTLQQDDNLPPPPLEPSELDYAAADSPPMTSFYAQHDNNGRQSIETASTNSSISSPEKSDARSNMNSHATNARTCHMSPSSPTLPPAPSSAREEYDDIPPIQPQEDDEWTDNFTSKPIGG